MSVRGGPDKGEPSEVTPSWTVHRTRRQLPTEFASSFHCANTGLSQNLWRSACKLRASASLPLAE